MNGKLTRVIWTFCLLFFGLTISSQTTTFEFEDLFDDIEANSSSRNGDGGSGGEEEGGTTSTSTGGGVGGGNSSIGIELNWPNDGKVMRKSSTLSWSSLDNVENYDVTITVKNDDMETKHIFAMMVKGTSMELPLDKLALDEGKTYNIQVQSADSEMVKSKKASFTIVPYKFYKDIIYGLKANEDYKAGSSLNKMLMKAHVLRINGLNNDAEKIYTTYLESDKDDMIMRNMRDNFRKTVGMN